MSESSRNSEAQRLEETRLLDVLKQATAQEQAGRLEDALKLYAQYKQEFVAFQEGKERTPLSPEHQKALAEIFGKDNKLEPIPMPSPETLTDEYFARMYPEKQTEEDKKLKLVSFRPDWWNQPADAAFLNKRDKKEKDTKVPTWGDLYIASMRTEATTFKGKTFLTESLQKPNYKDGAQAYGSVEGDDPTKDPLLPLIQEVFGEKQTNRFNLKWDDITTKLIPKLKEVVAKKFKDKDLTVPPFDIVCTPALVANRAMTEHRRENSSTTTGEWSSTPFFKEDGTDSGHRLLVGSAAHGGAAYVSYDHRGFAWVAYASRSCLADKILMSRI